MAHYVYALRLDDGNWLYLYLPSHWLFTDFSKLFWFFREVVCLLDERGILVTGCKAGVNTKAYLRNTESKNTDYGKLTVELEILNNNTLGKRLEELPKDNLPTEDCGKSESHDYIDRDIEFISGQEVVELLRQGYYNFIIRKSDKLLDTKRRTSEKKSFSKRTSSINNRLKWTFRRFEDWTDKHIKMEAVIVGVVGFIGAFLYFSLKKLHSDVKDIPVSSIVNIATDSLQTRDNIAGEETAEEDESDLSMSVDSNMRVILNRYPKAKIRYLFDEGNYYYAITPEDGVHFLKLKDGTIEVDKIFPNEYGSMKETLKAKNKILIGLNWVGQCKIVTLSTALEPISSKIYNYDDGEWTQLDSLVMLSDDSYYAEIRTGCNDCGFGKIYKIKARLDHKLISSSVEEYTD